MFFRRPARTTVQPSSSRTSAESRPMPLPAPVMTAILVFAIVDLLPPRLSSLDGDSYPVENDGAPAQRSAGDPQVSRHVAQSRLSLAPTNQERSGRENVTPVKKTTRLRQLIHRQGKVLAVLHPPSATHARIMELAGCEAGFVGTSGVVGSYTGLA